MADTVGSLIDKLFTVDTKMWNNQELLYKIRKMDFEEYLEAFFKDKESAKKLWNYLSKSADLNFQRNEFIDEIDKKLIEMINLATKGELSDDHFVQKKHKTY